MFYNAVPSFLLLYPRLYLVPVCSLLKTWFKHPLPGKCLLILRDSVSDSVTTPCIRSNGLATCLPHSHWTVEYMGMLHPFGHRPSVRSTERLNAYLPLVVCSFLLFSANRSRMDLASASKLSNHPSVLDIAIMQEHSGSIKITLTAKTDNSKMYHV